MAIGDVTQVVTGSLYRVELLASATATNGAPSGASAGLDVNALRGLGSIPTTVGLEIVSTAGSGTMTATYRIWGYGSDWIPLGTGGTGTTKGTLNSGSADTEASTDVLRHAETLNYPGLFSRLYLEITAIGGTATAVTGYIRVCRGL